MVASDVIARAQRARGKDVFFLTGTDEHGAKIAQAAEKQAKNPQQFTDEVSKTFRDLTELLSISNSYFIRTTDKEIHQPGVIKLWNELVNRGALYKGSYEGLYCVGHEAYLKSSDLVNGVCPDHKTAPQLLREENYFFKLTDYVKQLKQLYLDGTIVIRPHHRTNEVLQMLEDSEDVSFSRPRTAVQWGIPVPGDDNQLIYVWADALTNYISAIGYGRNDEWQATWPADVHMIGKDILRFHAITWPAMLLALGMDLPKAIYAHGHLTVDGEKMSKTIGNVVNPFDLAQKYPVDVIRYFLMREISSAEDGDFSEEKIKDRYRGDLAHNLGNLVSRVATLVEKKCDTIVNIAHIDPVLDEQKTILASRYNTSIDNFKLNEALAELWQFYTFLNQYLNEHKPWDKNATDQDIQSTLATVAFAIHHSVQYLEPFMPEISKKISADFRLDSNGNLSVTKTSALFPLES